MKLKTYKKQFPADIEMVRGEKWERLKNPISNQPITKWDNLSFDDLEKNEYCVFVTVPNGNLSAAKKAMFQETKYYYIKR